MKTTRVYFLTVFLTTMMCFGSVFAQTRRTAIGIGEDENEQVAKQLAFQDALRQIATEIRCHVIAVFDRQISSQTTSTLKGFSEQIQGGTNSRVSVRTSVRLEDVQHKVISRKVISRKKKSRKFKYKVQVSVSEKQIQEALRREEIHRRRNQAISQWFAGDRKRKIHIQPEIHLTSFPSGGSQYNSVLRSSLIFALNPNRDGQVGFYQVDDKTVDVDEELSQGSVVLTGAFYISQNQGNPPRIIASMNGLRISFRNLRKDVEPFEELSQVLAAEDSTGAFIKEFGLFAGQKLREDLFELLSQRIHVFQFAEGWESSYRDLFVDYLSSPSEGYQTKYDRARNTLVCVHNQADSLRDFEPKIRVFETIHFPAIADGSRSFIRRNPMDVAVSNYWELRANPSTFDRYGDKYERWIQLLIETRKGEALLDETGCCEIIDRLFRLRQELESSHECEGVDEFVRLIGRESARLQVLLPHNSQCHEKLELRKRVSDHYENLAEVDKLIRDGKSRDAGDLLKKVEEELTDEVANPKQTLPQTHAYYFIGDLYLRAYGRSTDRRVKRKFKERARAYFEAAEQGVDRVKEPQLYDYIQKALEYLGR